MDSYRFTIHGRLPGQNEFIAANRANIYAGNQMKRNAQRIVSAEILQQLKGVFVDCPVMIAYRYYEPNRKRDKDNVHAFASKVIHIENDGWKNIIGFEALFECDPDDPRIEVTITPYTEEML